MPAQKPGLSKQDYGTPRVFLDAVERRFGKIAIDLAAHEGNRVVDRYFSPDDDSLSKFWPTKERCWLNPPFGRIEPWARKCWESGSVGEGRIFFLVPASVGANWFADHVHGKSLVLALRGRLSFDGKNPFPKDCILCVYGVDPGFDVWDWRNEKANAVPRQ